MSSREKKQADVSGLCLVITTILYMHCSLYAVTFDDIFY